MLRPKPRHFGQAPSALLNEKSPGVGGVISISQCAQCHPVENGNISAYSDFGFASAGMTAS